ncbi:hypothetical protein M409DRAFT_27412 [Zasmidium cellare ATCC 36951]|uniref:Uncharacterized protein n=1 Tax=Zasmidium cellare ATCC 36951 TaxID=1080233 RepID=A0A6A6C810_ZASCE|nr:uncharacterized protein M409DRAFT_27412 [Zasmidium cellare ATCC 36951]KAF2162032.1 hypothetical protein M409DRAFT_27412 [Zasmidium cellare ATCC 36951]
MGTSNGDLVQAICERIPGNGGSICQDIKAEDEWCGYTYTLKASGDQPAGSESRFKAGDHFLMKYVYNDDTAQYDQYAYLNGDQVSQLSTDSGHAGGFGSAVECAATDCGTVPAHEWIDTVLTMDIADPNYGDTFGYNNADVTDFYTPDGGKTWKLNSAKIHEFTFT